MAARNPERIRILVDFEVRNAEQAAQAVRNLGQNVAQGGTGPVQEMGKAQEGLLARFHKTIAGIEAEERAFGRTTQTLKAHIAARRDLVRAMGAAGQAIPPGLVQETQQLERSMGRVFTILGQEVNAGRLLAWAVGWQAVYRGLNLVTGLITGSTLGALQRLADFQRQQLSLAAEFVNLNPALPFDRAMVAAGGFLNALVRLQPAFIGTATQFQEIAVGAARYGIAVDLATATGRREFLAFANAIALATAGINRQGQALQEIRSLAEGIVRPGAQLLQILKVIDPKIAEHIRLWREEGTVIQNVVRLLPGMEQAVARVGQTLAGQVNALQANINLILRLQAVGPGGLAAAGLRGVNAVLGAEQGLGGSAALTAARNTALVMGARFLAMRLLPTLLGGVLGGPLGLAAGGAFAAGISLREVELQREFLRQQSEADLRITPRERRLFGEDILRETTTPAGIGRLVRAETMTGPQGVQQLERMLQGGTISAEQMSRALRSLADDALTAYQKAAIQGATDTDQLLQAFLATKGQADEFDRALRKAAEALERFQRLGIREVGIETTLSFLGASQQPRATARANALQDLRTVREEMLRLAEQDFATARTDEERLERLQKIEQIKRSIAEVDLQQIRNAQELANEYRKQGDLLSRVVGQMLDAQQAARVAFSATGTAVSQQLYQPFLRGRLGGNLSEAETARTFAGLRQQQGFVFGQEIGNVQEALEELKRQGGLTAVERAHRQATLGAQLRDLLIQQAAAQRELNVEEREARRIAKDRDDEAELNFLRQKLALLQATGAETEGIASRIRQKETARATRQSLAGLSETQLQDLLDVMSTQLLSGRVPLSEDETLRARMTAIRQRIGDIRAERTQEASDQANLEKGAKQATDAYMKYMQPALEILRKDADSIVDAVLKRTQELHKDIVAAWAAMGKAAGAAFRKAFEDEYGRTPAWPQPGTQKRNQLPSLPRPTMAGGTTIIIGNIDATSKLSTGTKRELAALAFGSAGDRAMRDEYRTVGSVGV